METSLPKDRCITKNKELDSIRESNSYIKSQTWFDPTTFTSLTLDMYLTAYSEFIENWGSYIATLRCCWWSWQTKKKINDYH